jgi:hypothetical protein
LKSKNDSISTLSVTRVLLPPIARSPNETPRSHKPKPGATAAKT